MNSQQFKKILKESLSGSLVQVQAMCDSTDESLSICDFLSSEKSQKLIDMGEILRTVSTDRTFSPEDVEYVTQIISTAKKEFGENDEEVLNFEAAIKNVMNISGDIPTAMESLRKDFSKYDLG